MLKVQGAEEEPPLLQSLEDQRIGVLYKGAGPGGAGYELPVAVHQVDKGQAVLPANPVVVFAQGRGDVNDAGALGQGDIGVSHHQESLFVQDNVLGQREQGNVFHPHQVGAQTGGADVRVLPKVGFHQGLGQDVLLSLIHI